MEAWKFINYSSLSPVHALSLTAGRWGLGPFPANLRATSGYWKTIVTLNGTTEAWKLPYSCGQDPSIFSPSRKVESDFLSPPSTISAKTNLCSKAEACPSSGCVILIEGIGKTRAGPAGSSIIGLTIGISVLLAIIITTAIIMGCSPSKPSSYYETPVKLTHISGHLPPEGVRPYFNPPPPPKPAVVERIAAVHPANMARQVAQCSGLLRKMFKLDLEIWSMEGATDVGPERTSKMREANALFGEVERMVQTWKHSTSTSWSPEERGSILEICRVVEEHSKYKRYLI